MKNASLLLVTCSLLMNLSGCAVSIDRCSSNVPFSSDQSAVSELCVLFGRRSGHGYESTWQAPTDSEDELEYDVVPEVEPPTTDEEQVEPQTADEEQVEPQTTDEEQVEPQTTDEEQVEPVHPLILYPRKAIEQHRYHRVTAEADVLDRETTCTEDWQDGTSIASSEPPLPSLELAPEPEASSEVLDMDQELEFGRFTGPPAFSLGLRIEMLPDGEGWIRTFPSHEYSSVFPYPRPSPDTIAYIQASPSELPPVQTLTLLRVSWDIPWGR